MLPSAQLLLLYYIYQGCGELLTSDASQKLEFTPTSISRASRQLPEMGLKKTEKRGVQKVIFSEKNAGRAFLCGKGLFVIESFKTWFRGYEKQYVIIGGTACDLLMMDEGLDFRATKDINLVLIVEAMSEVFGRRFWEYVCVAGYEHRNKGTGKQQFYRFMNPKSREYPAMIELFTRKPDAIILPEDAVLSPLPIDEDISSLSAILLNDDYYNFLRQRRIQVAGVTVIDAPYLIHFKAKAWMDLSDRKAAGEQWTARIYGNTKMMCSV